MKFTLLENLILEKYSEDKDYQSLYGYKDNEIYNVYTARENIEGRGDEIKCLIIGSPRQRTGEKGNHDEAIYNPDDLMFQFSQEFPNVEKVIFQPYHTPTTIPQYAFHSMQHLKSIALPDSVTTIIEGAFEDCPSLSDVKLPKNLKEIPEDCFLGDAISEIILPDGLEVIGAHAFKDNKLTNITIPDSVKEIGEGAFEGNPLTKVTLPRNIVSKSEFFGIPRGANKDYFGKLQDILDFSKYSLDSEEDEEVLQPFDD